MKNALLSVSDKTGLIEFAAFLAGRGIRLLSTGGTARQLREAGLEVTDVSDYTGFPEMMDGRVKTLHPKIHGGLLHLRNSSEHLKQAEENGIEPIDLVVVNLYPFEQTLAEENVTHYHLIENIDIGGPSMLRSAAKNYQDVTVIVDPEDYANVQVEIQASGRTSPATREYLAAKVFRHTARYDHLIAGYLTSRHTEDQPVLPDIAGMLYPKCQDLRYGENPHQIAGLYGPFYDSFTQLHGKPLSYNNIIDISAAVNLMRDLSQPEDPPTIAILKHTNPCGVGTGSSLLEAWERALATDRQAPFGGIIIANRPLDLPVAEAIAEIFSEVIIAPEFLPDARERLEKKKNLRLIESHYQSPGMEYDFRSVLGGLLIQQSDSGFYNPLEWTVITERQPTPAEMKAMDFGWRVVKHVKSNAIVYCGPDRTLGIGAGQMARVDSSKIAVWKAGEAGLDLTGSVICSDAFFPFPDGIEAAAEAGATAAIQPGGSVRDDEVIAAANQANMAMIFTGQRHFRH